MCARRKRHPTWAVAVLAGGLTFAACDSGSSITAPVEAEPEVLAGLLYTAIQDEYHAEAVYEGVIEDFGSVTPFSNIMGAEIRHSAAIATLYRNRGWAVPANEWADAAVPHFGTLHDACSAGVEGELANIDVYDRTMTHPGLPGDVLQVFSSNRSASLERHLPAFQRCSS